VRRPEIFYSYPTYISFVRKDEATLKQRFNVRSFHFNQQRKGLMALEFLRHLVHIIASLHRTDAYVSFFAGYSSFVPAFFAKWFGKPHIIILGGTDCTSIPEIDYGNFRKKMLGWCTCASLTRATYLLPVSQNLVYQDYTYFETVNKQQGFEAFCRNAQAPCKVLPIGYDVGLFQRGGDKIPRSFLTVAQMSKANFFRKGIDLMFAAARRYPDCTFTVVGNNEAMRYDSVPPNVTLLPFVPYEELVSVYSKHRFYLQLSIMEGFPSAPCEAMLCECVPIVSAVGAMEEIVGDTGFILHKKDAAMFFQLLETALACDAEAIGKKARQHIVEKFPAEVRNELLSVVQSQIDGVRGSMKRLRD
jgi:glycosyltransferase involved in cell wall biosynthesis